jgi:hypothetical protein
MRRALLLPAVLVAATLACAEPLELAEWRIDVPPATPIIELQGVPLEERDAGTVRLVDDLVLGADNATTEALLYRPVGIVAAADGRMFVADGGDRRVLRFAADGGYLGSFGREGQGPGELLNIFSMAIAGDRIVIEDLRNGRLSVWTTEGEHVADHSLDKELMDLEGVGNEGFASTFTSGEADGGRRLVAAIHGLDGSERARLFDVPAPPIRIIRMGPGISNSTAELVRGSIAALDHPKVIKAVGAGGVIYVSPAHEYQVLAMSPDGGALWALRVAWRRPARSLSARQRVIDQAVRAGDGPAAVGDFDWPPAQAVELLRTDGAGRLYVFPTKPREDDAPVGPRMVDVYSSAGDFLAAGLVDHIWTHARGDHVYGLRTNERDEWVAVRYHLTVDEH